MNRLFKYLFFLSCIVELIRILLHLPFEHFSKPLIMMFLTAYFIASSTQKKAAFWLPLTALVFSWLGDFWLMYQDKQPFYFLVGLISFALAHVFYSFTNLRLKWAEGVNTLLTTQKLRHSFTLILAGVALVTILSPNLGEMRLPVTIYTGVIVFMCISALLRYGHTSIRSFSMVFGGAVCFMISDSLLAINKFMEPFSLAGFWVMLTYCLAQYLIIEGMINHKITV